MGFSNGQNVQAADLNNFSVTTVTTSGAASIGGAASVGGALTVTGAATITGGQVVFPAVQVPSTNANTLDDYEEGDWTPTIGGSGGQSGQVYSLQVGRYTKIGKRVTADFKVTLSTLGTITTNAQVQGLPFTSENTSNMISSLLIADWAGLTTGVVQFSGVLAANATAVTLRIGGAASTFLNNVAQADLSNTTSITGSISYMASA